MKLTFAGHHWIPDNPTRAYPEPYLVQSCDGGWVFAIASGSESGWDTSYKVANESLTYIGQIICEQKKDIEEAFQLSQKFLSERYHYADDPSLNDFGFASVSLLWGFLKDNQLSLYWLGTEEVYLIRDGQILDHTIGHSWARAMGERGFPVSDDSKNMTYRYLPATPELDLSTIAQKKWKIKPEDIIVLLTSEIVNEMQDEDLLRIIKTNQPQKAAVELVALTNDLDRRWGSSALVIQFSE